MEMMSFVVALMMRWFGLEFNFGNSFTSTGEGFAENQGGTHKGLVRKS